MLRIDFTAEDLNRLRVAGEPDPLWETVLSLMRLQDRSAALVFDPWRREVRAALARAGLTSTAAALMLVARRASYFPDFLTPGPGVTDLDVGIDLVLGTPKRRLAHELSKLFPQAPPPGIRRLGEGDPRALELLGEALRRYYEVAVAPYLPAIRAAVAADRSVRAEAALTSGPQGLLDSYGTVVGRDEEALVTDYPFDRGLRLDGRPLTIVPGFFCVRTPVALADPHLDPVLVHPLSPAPGWLARSRREATEQLPVAQLIGPSRAMVLDTLEHPRTTTELAELLQLTPPTTSRHATVLREAGLVESRRQGNRVFHLRTRLGDALMNGAL
ncbi:winged helix-turn-helix transcriptional regulator [Streptomyces sp. ISL-22]|uniref:ArsR family transcriptional regulator n=1 Tax=Streptomyces curacoi TaxID=146536 RepID=A0A117PK85_9ACTN|nr:MULTISPECIES: helix-turn-helix domain-containing protein [Streptomyces]KUM81162.1 ArsR family transcriptional regulator [Streptomyces curacoi]MBT2420057.1 winged helix-turn-helix transcriptional regulator [Streptomyces sp. ISL-24]MBT2433931.1 winged helix-turn-helix transcriptional regulator [Streptomyces sp. ISL-22]